MLRTHRVFSLLTCAVLIFTGITAAWAAEPTSEPAQMAAAPATQPTDAAMSMGVVRTALTQLYVVPRNAPAPIPGSAARAARKATSQPTYSGSPTITSNRNTAATTHPAAQIADVAATAEPQANGNPDPTATPDAGDARPVATVAIESTPWVRTGPNVSQKDREWADYRYYGGKPSRYGVGTYGGYGYDDGGTYRFGFTDGYDYAHFEGTADARVDSLMSHASVQLDRGVQYFRKAQYQQAADTFQLASETDQGDAVSRIYAGHSLFALGRYRDAVRYLRRAFELQPRIAYLTYDIRGDYDNPELFEEQLTALNKALDLSPRDPDRLFLIGYMNYYTGQRTAAFRYLLRAVEVNKNDLVADRLMRNAQPPDVEVDSAIRPAAQKK